MMNILFSRSTTWILTLCAGLMLIQTANSFAGENQDSGIQPSSDETEEALRSGEETSVEWKAVGDCLVAGDRDCVLRLLDGMIEEDPEAWEAYALRAEVLENLGDFVGAGRDRAALAGAGGGYAAIDNRLSRAINANPDNPDLVWQRAIHRWQAGNDVTGSLSDLDRVIVLYGGTAPEKVHMMRAKLLAVQGDYDGAILDYSTVIESESGYEATALTERARLFDLVGRTDDANLDREILKERHQARQDDLITSTSRRIEAHPEDIMSLYLRGMEYADREDLSAALADAEAIMHVAPDSWMGYSLRSKIRRKSGDFSGYREDRAMVKKLREEESQN